jgi:predicted TIM-barrel enzyme
MTPLRIRYEEAYLKAYPFDKLIDGMMSHHMVEETAEIMSTAIREGVGVNVIINNRAGGNAPLIAQKVSEKFLEKHPKEE